MNNTVASEPGSDGSHRISRRDFLKSTGKVLVGGAAAWAAKTFLVDPQGVMDSAADVVERRALSYAEVYTPTNPEVILSREATDRMFESFGLGEQYPTTINRDAFHTIIQRPGRIATLFFRPEDKKQLHDQEAFETYAEGFFKKMLTYSDAMHVDFIGTLLMFQVSGDANNSVKGQRGDVKDEAVRSATTIGEDAIGSQFGSLAITALRTLNIGEYYAYPRIQGPNTLGIHDIESVMIARALVDLEKTLPDVFHTVSKYLGKRAPNFFGRYKSYAQRYDGFEVHSEDIAQSVRSSPDVQQYLSKFMKPDVLRRFLIAGDDVDAYQLTKTTTCWAIISGMQQLRTASMYDQKTSSLGLQAMEQTIVRYMESGSPTSFFLDQINNPRMAAILSADAKRGDKTAQRLLDIAVSFYRENDNLVRQDRSMTRAIIEEQTEEDVDFQLATGVAYARWLLNDAHTFITGSPAEDITFTDPNDLAYHAFLATANRESAPTFQLVGVRPLGIATLTFGPPQTLFETMHRFEDRVYNVVEGTKAQQDFLTFSKYFLHLIEEPYVRSMTGVSRYRIDRNPTMERFIRLAEEFGAFENIISPPHSSWMRSFESTAPYISAMVE